MNKLKNESGYALVTVLLIITVFMGLFLSFAGQSFSTVKQNQIVEKKSQAVALAEMGVSYYQSMVYNIYLDKRDTVNTSLVNYMVSHPSETEEHYKAKAISLMKTAIEAGLTEKKNEIDTEGTSPTDTFDIEVQDGTNASFQVKLTAADPSYVPTNDEVSFHFKSTGFESGESASLSGTMKLALSLNPDGSSSEVTTETKVHPTFRPFYPQDIGVTDECTNQREMSSLDVCNKILITSNPDAKNNGTIPPSIGGNYNNESEKGIYSTVPLTIEGNGNGVQNINVISNDSITFGKNLNYVNDLFIKANGDTTLEGQFRADATEIYVKGQLELNGQSEFMLGSFVYVAGTGISPAVKINGSNNKFIIDNSKVCINGNLDASSVNFDILNNGKLIVKGSITGFDTVELNKTGVTYNITDPNEFLNLCGDTATETVTIPAIGWGDDISREVNY
jgi:hypothetical protein